MMIGVNVNDIKAKSLIGSTLIANVRVSWFVVVWCWVPAFMAHRSGTTNPTLTN